jgi:DNA-binding transcriptional regulator LsrR (DeoR family)
MAARRAGCLEEYPRVLWSADEVVAEVEYLRGWGVVGMSELAGRIGLSRRSVERHLATVRRRAEQSLTSRTI